MLILAMDTSTATGGVALMELPEGPEGLGEARLLGSVQFTAASMQGQRLMPSVGWLLDRVGRSVREVDAVAVATGPGSFTGLRIGMSAAKGLAWANGARLVGVSTLEAMALRAMGLGSAVEGLAVGVLVGARQGEVYGGLFAGGHGRERAAAARARLCRRHRRMAGASRGAGAFRRIALVGDGAAKHAGALAASLGERLVRLPPAARCPRRKKSLGWVRCGWLPGRPTICLAGARLPLGPLTARGGGELGGQRFGVVDRGAAGLAEADIGGSLPPPALLWTSGSASAPGASARARVRAGR